MKELTEEQIDLMIEEFNRELDTRNKKLRLLPSFSYDERLDDIINQLNDKEIVL